MRRERSRKMRPSFTSAVGQISLQGAGNGITDYSGNTLCVDGTVIQGYAEWGENFCASRGNGGGTANVPLTNVYNEPSSLANTQLGIPASTGLIICGQQVRSLQGIGPQGTLALFANTGANQDY